jgi:alpha-methylacyl-CoA racemase
MGPLKGIKVLDLTRLLPGPLCTHMLTRLGADVLKVEQPGGNGDYVRHMSPMLSFKDGVTHGTLFEALNGQKKNLVLDLKNTAGVSVLKRLAKDYDVIVEGNRPGVMDRLGVGYSHMKAENSKIIYCSISGYGSDGPMAKRAGHDINYMAISGLLGLSGPQNTLPPLPAFQAADATGALQAVIGIQAALIEKMTTGKGQFVDISLCEASMALAVPSLVNGIAEQDNTRGNGYLNGGLPNYGVYATKDGLYLSVGALEPHFWEKLMTTLQISDVLSPQQTVDLFASKTLSEWLVVANKCDVCLEPVIDATEVPKHPQHVHRKVFVSYPAGTVSPGPSSAEPQQLVLGPRMGNHGVQALRRAAEFGEDTVAVLREAGYSGGEIEELVRCKAVVAAASAPASVAPK